MSDEDSKKLERNIARDARRLLTARSNQLGPPIMSRNDIDIYVGSDLSINLNTKRFSLIHSKFKLPLSQLDFINIKSLYDLTIKSSKLNLLAGKNSSGKSTVIESIALISKWVNSSNTNYDGVPFGKDFNALSFNDFKSRNTDEEPAIIKFQFTNTLDLSRPGSTDYKENMSIGTYSFLLEFNELDANKEDLKFAPITNLRIEIDQFEEQEVPHFTPIKGVFEVNNQRDENILSDIVFSQKIFNNHLSKSPRHIIYGGFGNPQDLKEKDFDFDFKNYDQVLNTLNSSDSEGNNNKNTNTRKLLEKITSSAYFSASDTSKPDEKYTKIYGISFDNTEKKIKHFSKYLNGWIPVKKRILVRWLAMDYLISVIEQKVSLDDLSPDLNDTISRGLEKEVRSKLQKMYNNKKLESSFSDSPETFRKETAPLKNFIRDQLSDLCLIQSNELVIHYDLERGQRSTDYSLNSLLQNNYSNDDQSKHSHPIEHWLQGDTNKVNDYFQVKLKKFDEAHFYLFDKLHDKGSIDVLKIKNRIEDASEFINNMVTEKSVSDCVDKLDNHEESALDEIYENIHDFLEENENIIFPIMHEWDIEKYKILEFLSEDEHDSSTILIPNFPEYENPKLDLYGVSNEPYEPTLVPNFCTDIINKNLTESLEETFSTTIFVGPLRERMIKNDDIFSFNYPFLLGKSGELTGSFLGTFGETFIDFPSTDYFRGEKQTITVKTKTYLEHLSDWLNYIGIADEIAIHDNDIFVYQDKNKLQLENVGVGVSQVLPVLLSAMINVEMTDSSIFGSLQPNEDILLIEQPSLHLHPSAQAQLGDFFIAAALGNNKSIFLESHSEHIVNRVKTRKVELENEHPQSLKVFFASKEKSKTSILEMKIASDGSYDVEDYPDGFFDEAQKEAYSLYEKNLNKN